MEIDATTPQRGEVAFYDSKCGIKLHSHRLHVVACDYACQPNLAPPVGILVAVRIDHKIHALDLTDPRRTGEVLIRVSGQVFPLNIGEMEIVKLTAVKDGNDERACTTLSDLSLKHKIRCQLVDGVVDLLLRNK